jgi:hypothetical protein
LPLRIDFWPVSSPRLVAICLITEDPRRLSHPSDAARDANKAWNSAYSRLMDVETLHILPRGNMCRRGETWISALESEGEERERLANMLYVRAEGSVSQSHVEVGQEEEDGGGEVRARRVDCFMSSRARNNARNTEEGAFRFRLFAAFAFLLLPPSSIFLGS